MVLRIVCKDLFSKPYRYWMGKTEGKLNAERMVITVDNLSYVVQQMRDKFLAMGFAETDSEYVILLCYFSAFVNSRGVL